MKYTTILKNGKIALPKEVVEKLVLKEGCEVHIEVMQTSNKEYYGYLTSTAREFVKNLGSS